MSTRIAIALVLLLLLSANAGVDQGSPIKKERTTFAEFRELEARLASLEARVQEIETHLGWHGKVDCPQKKAISDEVNRGMLYDERERRQNTLKKR